MSHGLALDGRSTGRVAAVCSREGNVQSNRDRSIGLVMSCLAGLGLTAGLVAQDFSVLRINEVITDNETTGPADSAGFVGHDMVEIFNSGDVALPLGSAVFRDRLALSDTATQPPLGLWTFPFGAVIPPRGFLVIFLRADRQICDVHALFALDSDGSEPITLWGRAGDDGKRPIIDQVFLPPLRDDVSFARFPDGAGPAPVPVAETFQHFGFHPPGKATFGTCQGSCQNFDRVCTGAPNSPWENLAPSVSRAGHSTNHPAAGESLEIVASVKDDKEPVPPNIARVFSRFRVNRGAALEAPMTLASGILTGESDGQPTDRWSLWKGAIPGQPAGAQVEFTIHVEDAEGLTGDEPNPEDLCPEGTGPCNEIGVPGPGCEMEPPPSLRFRACETPFRYVSGYEPPDLLRALVINEVIASQRSILRDVTDAEFEDLLELFNASSQVVDLSGLWLSDRPFAPRGWQFPAGSSIDPGRYLIIWTDADGGLCPRPGEVIPGDGQECFDPTDPSSMQFHTSFQLERNGDELYLFDREETGFGVIHGIEFGPQPVNASWRLIPDGDRNGTFVLTLEPTPGGPNKVALFRRGDVDGICPIDLSDAVFLLDFLFRGGVGPACPDAADVDDNGGMELTDAVFLLNHLFQGGASPPFPGTEVAGPDPTPDDPLAPCVTSLCP
jgi:hypothetical protein